MSSSAPVAHDGAQSSSQPDPMAFEAFAHAAQELGLSFEASADTRARFLAACTLVHYPHDSQIAEQNARAKNLCFLKQGQAEFLKHGKHGVQKFSSAQAAFSPLGISALNSPGRYLSEIRVKADTWLYQLDLAQLRDLHLIDPKFGAQFFAFVLAKSTALLWATRGLEGPPNLGPAPSNRGAARLGDHDLVARLGNAAFFAPMGQQNLATLLDRMDLRLYSEGQVIAQEGAAATYLTILNSGRVRSDFQLGTAAGPQIASRSLVRPGVALSWACGAETLVNPYTIYASRDTAVLSLDNAAIIRLMTDHPMAASVLFQQQLWQIGRYQQSALSLLRLQDEDPQAYLRALIEDNLSRLPVDSRLHGVPHLLDNRFTVGEALDRVYGCLVQGNEVERSLAGLMGDALEGVEREHQFFKRLNRVYSRVAGATLDQRAGELSARSNQDFAEAFEQIPYVIKGLENLPDAPTNIFFYNHLAGIPQNNLANGHAFSLDSHFISAKILLPKYGDGGLRIVRTSRDTEFWRNGYYARLDNIFVHNRESDWLEETAEEKQHRKERLFIEAQQTFDAGRPLAIAPEGTSETPDNLTPTSPGPFKPGAFLLAGRLDPAPLLVPIALANFDTPVSGATFAAVIKPGFRIQDQVDVDDRAALDAFLVDYRETFRGFVAEARALAEEVYELAETDRSSLLTNVGLVSPVEQEFEADVRELEQRLATQPRPGAVVLYGSSTFRLWDAAAQDLSLPNLVNLGFGGATLAACRTYFDRLVVPHNPATLIVYGGDNDIGGGASAEQVAQEFQRLQTLVTEQLPETRGILISIKPSPFREAYVPEIQKANAALAALCEASTQWHYVDFFSPMMDKEGRPSDVFYDYDPLHVNATGYGLLAKLLRDALG